MESVLNLVVNAENVRTLVLLVFCFSGFVWLKTSLEKKIGGVDKRIDGVEVSLSKCIDELRGDTNKRIDELRYNDLASIHRRMDEVEYSLNKRIDGVEISLSKCIDDLKHNDFAHLNSTIEALTYALEKNGSLKPEDKGYVDSRLAR